MKVEFAHFPNLPDRLSRLGELAYNLWWSWNTDARNLFRNLDLSLWRSTHHNPVQMLSELTEDEFSRAVNDPEFLELYDRVIDRFDEYMSSNDTWASQAVRNVHQQQIAYLCAEFAVHTSLPIYSGGLGLLAGDTCKEASDLGLPFVAVGALYPEGYFRQWIEADGSQRAIYERMNTDLAPLLPVLSDDGTRFLVAVPVGEKEISVAIWKVQVGRVPIYLMDTDIPENEPWDRDLSARLYGGDQQIRLRQEIVLGMGGVRVLRALGYDPTVIHLNEGHAAFAALELLREYRKSGIGLESAQDEIRRRLVFTTHTPVAAGHDEFPFYMMEEHFRNFWEQIEISREDLLSLGTPPGGETFSMTVLALNCARASNGVSKKHGEVSRNMWHFLYPDRGEDQVPIIAVTNGVHVSTWLAPEFFSLLNEYLGEDWFERHDEKAIWERIDLIPDQELWDLHLLLKTKLFAFIRERTRRRWIEGGMAPGQMIGFGSLLDPEALTLGFARRFATYKRAGLILSDLDRLKRIVTNRWRPVQVIFAGKAHPADEAGKFLLQQIFQACSSHELAGRLAFIENYDKHVAHRLIQGVDVWLNNPQPPKEASGTSGQKASLNGVPNFSVLDGWWYEGYDGENGWAIEENGDVETADSIYRLLEEEIVPTFYERDSNELPAQWVRRMKNAVASTAAPFSTRRMVKDYVRQIYCLTSSPEPER